MSFNAHFNPNGSYYVQPPYPTYYPPYDPYQTQMLYQPQQIQSHATPHNGYLLPLSQSQNQMPYDPQQIQSHATPQPQRYLQPYYPQQPSYLVPLSLDTQTGPLPLQALSSNSVKVTPSTSTQKRTQITIDSRDISNAYLENLAEKVPDLEKLIITFWDTSYKIQNVAHQSEVTSQTKTNPDSSTTEHTELTIDSQNLTDEYLTTLVQRLNLDKLIIKNPFHNKKINYAICKRPRVFQSVPTQSISRQTVDELATQLQALQLSTLRPTPVVSSTNDIKENNRLPQPIEEEKRLKKREQPLHKINTYTKERLSPEHLKNSPSLLRCMFGHPRSPLLRFFLDPEVFFDKTVKEFMELNVYNLLTCCKTLYPVWKIYVQVLKNAFPKSIYHTQPKDIEHLASIAHNAALKGPYKTYKEQYPIKESIAITETILRSFTTLDMRRFETSESNPNWLQPFIKFYPNIVRLHLPFFEFNEGYGEQLQKFLKLKELDMSLCISKHANGLQYLPQLTQLYAQYPFEQSHLKQSHLAIPRLNDNKTPSSFDSKEGNSIKIMAREKRDNIQNETNKMYQLFKMQQLAIRKHPHKKRLNENRHYLFKFTHKTAAVLKHLRNLQVLNLGSAHAITKETLDLISKSKDLQELYIFNASQISDTDLESLATLKLKKFSIVGWEKITAAGVKKILELFPQLTELWVDNIQIITNSMKSLVVHSTKSPLQIVYVRQTVSIEKTKEYYDIWKKYQDLFVHLPVHI